MNAGDAGGGGPSYPPERMDTPDHEPLVDFDALRGRVGGVLVPLAGLSLLGAVVDGAIRGLTFALLGRWAGIFILVTIFAIAVLTAMHALAGAGRAERRGERLASPDVGLSPRKIEGRSLRNALEDMASAANDSPGDESEGDDADASS